jgi:HK97 family phage portal protein
MGARARRRALRARQQQDVSKTIAPYALGAGFTPPASWPVSWWQQGYRVPRSQGHAAVEACIGAISQVVAQLPITHWRERDDGGRDAVKGSAASRVLRRPNHYQTRADFFLNLVRNELYRGNGVAVATRDDRFRIDSLHVVPGDQATPLIAEETGDVFYSTRGTPLLPTPPLDWLWPARDVLHIRMHTPHHPLIGVTPLEAAAAAVATGEAINTGVGAFMTHLVRPSGYLAVPPKIKLGKETQEALRQDWSDNASGVHQGRIGVLMEGIEWKPMEMTAFDEAVVKAYAMTTADIARVFRVPLPVINELGGATFNNSETLIRHWHATGLGFVLEHIELALDTLFELPEGEYVEFDVEYILRSDFAARMEGLTKAVSGGIYTPNEARAKEGLSRKAHGDEPRLQAQVVPLSAADGKPAPSAPAAPAAPANPSDDDEEEEDKAAPVIGREVLLKMIEGTVDAA